MKIIEVPTPTFSKGGVEADFSCNGYETQTAVSLGKAKNFYTFWERIVNFAPVGASVMLVLTAEKLADRGKRGADSQVSSWREVQSSLVEGVRKITQ